MENYLYYDAIHDFSVWLRTGSIPAYLKYLLLRIFLIMFDCLQQEKLEVSVFVRLETILEVHPMDSTIKIKFKGTL